MIYVVGLEIVFVILIILDVFLLMNSSFQKTYNKLNLLITLIGAIYIWFVINKVDWLPSYHQHGIHLYIIFILVTVLMILRYIIKRKF